MFWQNIMTILRPAIFSRYESTHYFWAQILLKTKPNVPPPRKQADDETDAKSGPECAAVVPPHSCKCLACHQTCICGRAGMRRIWGPAAGPHIWLWPLAGQLGPYNLGSHSSLWPGERIDTQTHADTHIHQRQQQQHPTSTTWTKHGMWSLHHVTQSKSCSGQRRWGSSGETQEGLHMHTCSLHKLLTFRSAACVWDREGRGRWRARRACLHCVSPSSITLNRKVIDYGTRAEGAGAEYSAPTPACMHTTPDMLTLPTCSNTERTARQHSWTLILMRTIPTLQQGGLCFTSTWYAPWNTLYTHCRWRWTT